MKSRGPKKPKRKAQGRPEARASIAEQFVEGFAGGPWVGAPWQHRSVARLAGAGAPCRSGDKARESPQAQGSPDKPKKAQERLGTPRKPREAQESPGKPTEIQGNSGEPKKAWPGSAWGSGELENSASVIEIDQGLAWERLGPKGARKQRFCS